MGRRDRQNRKKSRKLKAKRPARPVALAYRGNKYRTEELVPTLFRTETGIYESFVITERELTDHNVRSALERLILQIRRGTLSSPEEIGLDEDEGEGTVEDLVIWNIRRNWQDLFQTEPPPGRSNLVGVLRTILGSIECWGSIAPESRGYLQYIEGFLKNAGVSVEAVGPETMVMPTGEW